MYQATKASGICYLLLSRARLSLTYMYVFMVSHLSSEAFRTDNQDPCFCCVATPRPGLEGTS